MKRLSGREVKLAGIVGTPSKLKPYIQEGDIVTAQHFFKCMVEKFSEMQQALGGEWETFAEDLSVILNGLPPEPSLDECEDAVDNVRALRETYSGFAEWYKALPEDPAMERRACAGAKHRSAQESIGHLRNHLLPEPQQQAGRTQPTQPGTASVQDQSGNQQETPAP